MSTAEGSGAALAPRMWTCLPQVLPKGIQGAIWGLRLCMVCRVKMQLSIKNQCTWGGDAGPLGWHSGPTPLRPSLTWDSEKGQVDSSEGLSGGDSGVNL